MSLQVGLWPGELSTAAAVDAAVQCEARAAGLQVQRIFRSVSQ